MTADPFALWTKHRTVLLLSFSIVVIFAGASPDVQSTDPRRRPAASVHSSDKFLSSSSSTSALSVHSLNARTEAEKSSDDEASRRALWARRLNTKSNEARALLQADQIPEDTTGDIDDVSTASDDELRVVVLAGHVCRLTLAKRYRYLDLATRTWSLDAADLDDIDDDIQAIIDCTQAEDIVLFTTTKAIRPTSRVTLPWPLTISASVPSVGLSDGVFPRAENKTTFRCPGENQGVFLVRSRDVTLANLVFEDCVFNKTDGTRDAIVSVEKCISADLDGVLRLHHVDFRRNTLLKHYALKMQSSSCTDLELVDFGFARTDCDGPCGVALSTRNNRLRDVRVHKVAPPKRSREAPSVFHAPSGSQTAVRRLSATENEVKIFRIDNGSLTLEDSELRNNVLTQSTKNISRSVCVHLREASVSIRNCTFRDNEAEDGAAVFAERSSVELRRSILKGNRGKRGGALYLVENTVAVVDDCTLESNSATEGQGGAVYVASWSTCRFRGSALRMNLAHLHGGAASFLANASGVFRDVRFTGNRAERDGGSLYLLTSNVTLKGCSFSDGEADRGGLLYASSNSSIDIHRSQLTDSSSRKGGGCLWSEGVKLIVKNSTMDSCSTSGEGGAMALQFTNATFRDLEISSSEAHQDGGGIFAVGSNIEEAMMTLIGNRAEGAGGGMSVQDGGILTVKDAAFQNNTAGGAGGAVCAKAISRGRFTRTVFSNNLASESAGSLYSYRSSIDFYGCAFDHGRAEEHGGFIAVRDEATVSIRHTTFESALAKDGGCLHAHLSHFILHNVTLEGCSSVVDGGMLRLSNASAEITNTTMVSNQAGDDGGCLYAEFSTVTGDGWTVDSNLADDHAGALRIRLETQFALANSVFHNNRADRGGAVSLELKSNARFSNVTFINSSAATEGGAFYVTASETHLDNCTFQNSSAGDGGFLFIKRNANVTIDSSTLKNGTGRNGACLRAVSGHLSVRHSEMHHCTSTEDGGAMRLSEVKADIYHSSFHQNSAKFDGGAIFADKGELTGIGLTIRDNIADEGGGILLWGSTFVIENAVFTNNAALGGDGGGAMCVRSSSEVELDNAIFERNSCPEQGGAVLVEASRLSIKRSVFRDGEAKKAGGFLSAISNSAVVVEESQMSRGSAEKGGAVAVLDASFEGRHLEITSCTAGSNGGAFVFESEKAPQNNTATFSGCTFGNNSASFGGGLYATTGGQSPACSDEKGDCPVVTLQRTIFERNNAEKAGGAIFVSQSRNLRIKCPAPNDRSTRSPGKRKKSSPDGHTLSKGGCAQWTGNKAKLYGDVVASYASRPVVSVEENGVKTVVTDRSTPYRIKDYKSGSSLPTITLQVQDDFRQSPAVGRDFRSMIATVFSPDKLFAGTQSLLLDKRQVKHQAVGFAKPGVYTILLKFEDDYVETVEIKVEVQKCMIDEVPSISGTLCEKCSATTYSFNPTDDEDLGCQPCPANGNCESHVITPNDGYWHSSPCSVYIRRCLTSYACNFDERKAKLQERTKHTESCDLSPTEVEDYQKAQCAKGHSGPLCGSCESGHGSSLSSKCQECPTTAGNLMVIASSTLILLVLSAITIRGTLSALRSDHQDPADGLLTDRVSSSSSAASASAEPPTDKVPDEADGFLGEGQSTTQSDRNDGVHASPSVLAKWKAVEMLKITLNYVQVTILIASVDVGWAVSMLIIAQVAEFLGGLAAEGIRRSVVCLSTGEQSMHPTALAVFVTICAIPTLIFLLLSLFWIAVAVYNRVHKPMRFLMMRCLLSVMVLWYIASVPVMKTAFGSLLCVNVHDSQAPMEDSSIISYWAVDTSLECFKGDHRTLSLLIWFFVGIIYGGLLGFLIIVLCSSEQQRTNIESWIYQTTGFLYRSFKSNHLRYWEVVVLVRKILIAFLLFCAQRYDSQLPIIGVAGFIAIAMGLQIIAHPYRDEFSVLNNFEVISLFVSLLMSLVAAALKSEIFSAEWGRVTITALCGLLNISTFAVFVSFLFGYFVEYVKLYLTDEGETLESSPSRMNLVKTWMTHEIGGLVTYLKHSSSENTHAEASENA